MDDLRCGLHPSWLKGEVTLKRSLVLGNTRSTFHDGKFLKKARNAALVIFGFQKIQILGIYQEEKYMPFCLKRKLKDKGERSDRS